MAEIAMQLANDALHAGNYQEARRASILARWWWKEAFDQPSIQSTYE